MSQRTYTIIELVGVSDVSYDDAARRAIARASQTLKGLGWFKITELRGLIRDGGLTEYQVTLQLGFRLMTDAELAAAKEQETGQS